MKTIAIVGTGAIGSYYGVRLAFAGSDVRFLLRGDLAHVRQHGFTLRENGRIRRLEHPTVFGATTEIGPVDIVLVTLKTTANGALPDLLPPLLGKETIVVTLQNGLGNEAFLASLVGADRVLGGLCFIAITREGPGELIGYHTPGTITLGEFGRPAAARTRALAQLFSHAGIDCQAVDNLEEAHWRKLIWNIPFNGLSIAAGGLTTEQILSNPKLAREVRALMEEVAAAARRLGCEITEDFIEDRIRITAPMRAYKPSSLIDFLAGRDVEVEEIWGEPLRRAQALGLPMPHLKQLYAELKRATLKV